MGYERPASFIESQVGDTGEPHSLANLAEVGEASKIGAKENKQALAAGREEHCKQPLHQ